ncbi:hypothetical protein RFI_03231 [Reticulomyxa filosa]|uniref:Actin n=1 Tax=Reticulomyxa filosa TaxID=46433 RepID=X6P5P7_RETFI|nr:hypothetical protein RFI_03231 [Reticulomyxa filosa]|eukprot:ETO33860.1 hypothetical protein RFI_03231 [Reticulomyxa filosa]
MDDQLLPNVIVIDTGSYQTRGGFGGDDVPQCVLRTCAGRIGGENTTLNQHNPEFSTLRGGTRLKRRNKPSSNSSLKTEITTYTFDTTTPKENVEIVYPFREGMNNCIAYCITKKNETGKIADASCMLSLWQNVINQCLRSNGRNKSKSTIENKHDEDEVMSDDVSNALSNHPLLFSEPCEYINCNSSSLNEWRQSRELWCKLAFEGLNINACYMCKDSVLSCFASGQTSGLIIDSGHKSVRISPVSDEWSIVAKECQLWLSCNYIINKTKHIIIAIYFVHLFDLLKKKKKKQ